jgi:hypothetical protein
MLMRQQYIQSPVKAAWLHLLHACACMYGTQLVCMALIVEADMALQNPLPRPVNIGSRFSGSHIGVCACRCDQPCVDVGEYGRRVSVVAGISPNSVKVLWCVAVRCLMYAAGSATVLAAMLCEGRWCYCAVVACCFAMARVERCVSKSLHALGLEGTGGGCGSLAC